MPTVELLFGTKSQLLKAVIDVAIAGDREPVPVLEREWTAVARATGTVGEFLRIFGESLLPAMNRSAGLVLVAREAAALDPESAVLSRRIDAQRTGTVSWLVDGIIERTPLRGGLDRDRAVDIVWMLIDPVTFVRLTRDRGWTPDDFVRWLIDAIPRLLLPHVPDQAATQSPVPGAARGGDPMGRAGPHRHI